MEIKCNVCGTINDGSTNFCKECFQKLDAEVKIIEKEEPNVVSLIEDEENNDIPWQEIEDTIDSSNEIINSEIEQINNEENLQTEMVSIEDNVINGKGISEVQTIDDDWNQSISKLDSNEFKTIDELSDNYLKNDDWNDDWDNVEEEVEKIPNYKFIFKFFIYFLIVSGIMFGSALYFSKFANDLFDPSTIEIVKFIVYRLVSLMTLLISAKLTFIKVVPKMSEINKVSFTILWFIALPSILIQLFILGFIEDTKVLMFIIGIMLSLIILYIFLNYLRKLIKKKNNDQSEDKIIFVYGVINIILIIMLLFSGIYARKNNLDMPKINFLYDIFENSSKNEEIIYKFINQVELTIIKNQTEIENYELPKVISDISYAKYDDVEPESIIINLTDEGAISNGEIIYRGIKYIYDGENVKAE